MSALSAATNSGNFNHMSAHSSAPVFDSTRKVSGFSVNVIGQVADASFTLEYIEGGTRITLGDKSCVVGFRYSGKHNVKLVHVQLRSDKIKPLHPLWSGVRGGRLIGKIGEDDCFVQIPEGQQLSVFYNDGTVAVFASYKTSTTAFGHNLKPEQAFDTRFGHVKKMLAEAAQLQGDDKILKQDRNLHELAAIVGMSTRYPEMRKQVMSYVTKQGIPLRPKVFDHFRQACTLISDMDSWMQIRAFHDNMQVVSTKLGTSPLGSKTKGNSLAAERARKAARANHDRTERLKSKGTGNGGGNQQNNGKGNKKGKKK